MKIDCPFFRTFQMYLLPQIPATIRSSGKESKFSKFLSKNKGEWRTGERQVEDKEQRMSADNK
jgi:hypothetical protein